MSPANLLPTWLYPPSIWSWCTILVEYWLETKVQWDKMFQIIHLFPYLFQSLSQWYPDGLPHQWSIYLPMHVKDPVILISSDLSWSDHISRITSRAYKILGLVRRTFASSNISTKKKLDISLVRSQLTYGSQVWRPLLQKDINPIKHIQRRATKYILNDYTSEYRNQTNHT